MLIVRWGFGEVFDEFVGPIYGAIPAVAIKEERSVVFPIRANCGVPVSDFAHLLKRVLEQVTPQTLPLKIVFNTEPSGMQPALCIGVT